MRPTIVVLLSFSVTYTSVGLGPPSSAGQEPAQPASFEIRIHEGRPLAAAVEVLERRHALVITYEDPIYRHESDLSDVTLEVRKDLHRFEPGKAPKVLVPRAAPLHINYVASPENVIDVRAVIEDLIKAHAQQGNPGVFQLAYTDGLYHVIPTAVKGDDGKLAKGGSIFDAKISFSEEDRTGFETLQSILGEVRKATSNNVSKIAIGMYPGNLLHQSHVRIGASEETARAVLSRLMTELKGKASWQLFYDPGLKWYVLNVHIVPDLPLTGPGP